MILDDKIEKKEIKNFLQEHEDLLTSLLGKKEAGLLLEEYYGKNSILLEIEKLAEVIRQKCISNPYYDPNICEENKKIVNLFSKLFNVEDINLRWNLTQISANSLTYPLSLLLFTSESFYEVEKGKYGIRFKNPDGKFIFIETYTSLFTLTGLTASEWVAVILHEIGHNFFISKSLYTISKIKIVIYITNLIIQILKLIDPSKIAGAIAGLIVFIKSITMMNKISRSIITQIDKVLNEFPILKNVKSLLQQLSTIILDIPTVFFQVVSMAFLPLSILNTPQIFISSLMQFVFDLIFKGYQNEKFSDNFATSFGYGIEVANYSKKFHFAKNNYLSFILICEP